MEEMPDLDTFLENKEICRKMFRSEQEGFKFYNSYAKEKGFSVRKSYCEKDKVHNEVILRSFVCSREGFRTEKNLNREIKKRKPRNITRVGCRAKFVIARDENTLQWYVKDFKHEHNHLMVEPSLACLLRSHRGISVAQKAEIVQMHNCGIRKHQIMEIQRMQYGGYDKVGYTSRDLYNFFHRHKVETIGAGDAKAVISYVTERRNTDPDFFFESRFDVEGHLLGLLWCDIQSRFDYDAFGDVVVFDSTYKTNRYNLPLVSFVGLNHHGSTVIFACAVTSQENTDSFVWMLRALTNAMAQKHPVSVITDGDLAMQKAIGIVWPNSSHRLCIWHIERNIVGNLDKESVRKKFRRFLYDVCSIEEIERRWLKFLDKNKVTDKDSWVYKMYDSKKLWCAAYHVGKCYLGLRSNQRSESLHSSLQDNLDRKMTLLDLVKHYDRCLTRLRNNEAYLDCEAQSSGPCLQQDASVIEEEAAKMFTPSVFSKVQFSMEAANKCFVIDILDDGCGSMTYIVRKKDKGDKLYHVACDICVEGNLKKISCSCLKLQSMGIPCSHILFVLGYREEHELPVCCVLKRWTMGAKRGFPPIRKSTMLEYSDSLQRYCELRNISQTASFVASSSLEAYERLKHVLEEEADGIPPNGGENGGNRYGPVLPQAMDAEFIDVLDPLYVPGRGAPKKNLKSVSEKGKTKCTLCKGEGHNRRTCPMRKEEEKLPEDVVD